MKYRKLELLFLSVGLVMILVSILISIVNDTEISEIFGQALMVPVFFMALHYGRHHGYIAAIFAALIYLTSTASGVADLSLTTQSGQVIVIRTGAYGLIGILGGELAIRTKYVIAQLTDENLIDNKTHVFSRSYLIEKMSRALDTSIPQRPFSMIVISVGAQDSEDELDQKWMPKLAFLVREHIRLVDEVCRLDEGRFCLILPGTPSSGIDTITKRLQRALRSSGYTTIKLSYEGLSLPGDENKLRSMVDTREPAHVA